MVSANIYEQFNGFGSIERIRVSLKDSRSHLLRFWIEFPLLFLRVPFWKRASSYVPLSSSSFPRFRVFGETIFVILLHSSTFSSSKPFIKLHFRIFRRKIIFLYTRIVQIKFALYTRSSQYLTCTCILPPLIQSTN